MENRNQNNIDEDRPPDEDQIFILTANHLSRTVLIHKPGVTIGSKPENDIVLDDPQVAPYHARIEIEDGHNRVIDLNSASGTFLGDLRLRAGVPVEWKPEEALRIGENWLELRLAGEARPAEAEQVSVLPEVDPNLIRWSAGKQIGVYLAKEQIAVAPGRSGTVALVLYNHAGSETRLSLKVSGVPQNWIGSLPSVVVVPAQEERQVGLAIRLPPLPTTHIGRHGVTIRVTSLEAPAEKVECILALTVLASSRFTCALLPGARSGAFTKTAQLKIQNVGNVPETYTISASDPATRLKFSLSSDQCKLAEGGSALLDLAITTPLDLFSVSGRTYPFFVQVRSGAGQVQKVEASVNSLGLLPVWLVPIVVVGILGLCGASAWGLAASLGRGKQTATPTVFGAVITQTLTATATQPPPTATQVPPSATPFPTATQQPTATSIPPSATAIPTATSVPPSNTPVPTATPVPPTNTPIPTATPVPPTPTATAVPPTATATPIPVTVSGWIAFLSNRDGPVQIYLYHGDTQTVLRLTNDPTDDQHLDWTRTGNKIAFDTARDGNREIYSMNVDGSAQTNLTNNPAQDTDPVWSPDGAHIAFLSDRDGNTEIYVMNADGSQQTRLTNTPTNECCVQWSPLGNAITFLSDRSGQWGLYRMNPDGSNQSALAVASPVSTPSWSPDGSRIAFVSDQDGNAEIYAINADGTGLSRLTNNTAQDTNPLWSPNSSQIAFLTNRDGNFEIYSMNPDGSSPRRLTNSAGNESSLVWSPDGSQLAFASDTSGNVEMYVLNISNLGVLRLTNNPANDAPSAWRP